MRMCVDKKRNRVGRLLFLCTAGVMVAGFLAPLLHGQSFILSQNGTTVGSASLQLKQSAAGYDLTSGAKINMQGLNYSFSETGSLDGQYHFKSVQLNGTVNGTAATVNAAPQGQQFVMKIKANGNVTNTPLAFHPQTLLLPDFDPAGLQVLLQLGAANNNRDIWALIPKQSGSIAPLRIATNADMQGTLNGKPVEVHHLTVTADAGKTEVFSGPSNELLQAEWSDEGFALVRQGFKLTPPARPGAPPAQPKPAATAAQPKQPTAPQQ
jgi:hypothetical protein